MSRVKLNNRYPHDALNGNLYYPRLQINKRGEIVLALRKSKNGLTRGILVGKTRKCKSDVRIGQKFDDLEVCGELTDYNGEVTVTFNNMVKNEAVCT